MHIYTRVHYFLYSCMIFVFFIHIGFAGGESKILRLYDYNSIISVDTSDLDVFHLEDFVVVELKYQTPKSAMRDLERVLEKRSTGSESNRIEIVPDGREDMPRFLLDERVIPVHGATGLKLDDFFLIDLPGGGVLRAQFRSGVSMRVNKNMKIILRPSRKKLISVRWDW